MTQFRKFTWLRDLLWLTALAVYIIMGIESVPFHGDESTTLWMSRDYYYFAVENDLDRLRYSETPFSETEQQMRLVAAPLPKYVLGLAWTLDGYTADDINDQWLWGAGWEYNRDNGHLPSDDLLHTARWASSIMLIGSVICLFYIARMLGGTPVAYLTSLIYTLTPAILINGRRAMLEGTTLFTALLVVLAGLWLVRHRTWGSALLLGFASGLAVASKHPNVITVLVMFIVIGAYTIYRSVRDNPDLDHDSESVTTAPDDPYALLTMLIVAGFVALGMFYALNPAWWDAPIERIGDTVDFRLDIINTQVDLFGGYDTFGDQVDGFIQQVIVGNPQYYEAPEWAEMIGGQIADYENSAWAGVNLGKHPIGAIGLGIFTVIGAWLLMRQPRLQGITRVLVITWMLTIAITTLLITPLEWARYYLIAHIPIALLVSITTWHIIGTLWARFKQLRSSPNSQNA